MNPSSNFPATFSSRLPDLHGTLFAISGASGFIGRHLVALLHRHGANVVMLRRPGSPAVPYSTTRTHVLDFSDARACAASLRRLRPTHIVHLAGYANSDRSVAAITRSLEINLVSSMNFVLGAMDAVPEARLVLAGTLETSNPWLGATEVGSPYGISKAMLEVLSGGLQQLYGANVINAKIGMTYGPDDPNEQRLVPTVINSLLRNEVPTLSSGTRRCDWIYVEDVAEALLLAALLTKDDRPPSVDIGSGELTSIREVTETLRQLAGSEIEPFYNTELDRPNEQERAADIAATEALLGWKASTSLTDGLARTVRWHRRRHADLRAEASSDPLAMTLRARPGA